MPRYDETTLTCSELNRVVIEEQLARILKSSLLARAAFLNRLIEYLVQETLNGNAARLKENWLGAKVFNRDYSYNPAKDPIVRVQVRRLRHKLAEYYQTEGSKDPVRISIPVGNYVPVFTSVNASRWAIAAMGRRCALAVLPILPVDSRPASARFAEAMTAELTQALIESGGIEVVSRTSALSFRNAEQDVREIGKALNADFVVEGSIRLSEQYHRLSLQLTATGTGYHCWGAWFEQRNTRISSDARGIAHLIRRELLEEEFAEPLVAHAAA